ncbi:hypothetical protein AZE42_03364 [Rhizopogon vesiculosus]|uniref:Uncharacterized protein n=1 Tax=Rhizopogon vesiculosus TaxID=180088 RepID=A0A1J8PJ26_9AGAM|nr:hypothetical protein AZE42_03364 [Rhizopogon vesiculosus]
MVDTSHEGRLTLLKDMKQVASSTRTTLMELTASRTSASIQGMRVYGGDEGSG